MIHFWLEKAMQVVRITLNYSSGKFTAMRKKPRPFFTVGKFLKICILQNIVMIILIFNVFWSIKLISMVNFTLLGFPGMFMATPICGIFL